MQQPLSLIAVANWVISSKLAWRLERLPPDDLAALMTLSCELRRKYASPGAERAQPANCSTLQLYQAIADLFADADEPALLFLDDAQWCDVGSLEWLQYLLTVHPAARLLVVIARRTGEAEHPWLTLVKTELIIKGRRP